MDAEILRPVDVGAAVPVDERPEGAIRDLLHRRRGQLLSHRAIKARGELFVWLHCDRSGDRDGVAGLFNPPEVPRQHRTLWLRCLTFSLAGCAVAWVRSTPWTGRRNSSSLTATHEGVDFLERARHLRR